MNRTALLEVLNRPIQGRRPVALANPPTLATCATSGHSTDPLAELLPAPTTPAYPPGPEGRLQRILDTWAGMDEATWPEANVKALYEDIMDIFKAHPAEADGWFQAWRKAHPEAGLC